MPLTAGQRTEYKDRRTLYRVTAYNSEGDPLGYRMVSGEIDIPCRLYPTSQYDTPNSVAGLSNKDNILTADYLREESGRGTRADDVMKVVQKGSTEELWYSVKGAPENHPSRGAHIANYQMVYLAITPRPTLIGAGYPLVYAGSY